MLFHYVFEQMHWGNPYHLLCASPIYSRTGVTGKSLLFTMCFPILFFGTGVTGNPLLITMCFPILFPDGRYGESSTNYYVLPRWIGLLGKSLLFTMCFPIGSGYWGNLYYFVCASPLNRVPFAHCYWGNLYYFVCDSPVIDFRVRHRSFLWSVSNFIGETSII